MASSARPWRTIRLVPSMPCEAPSACSCADRPTRLSRMNSTRRSGAATGPGWCQSGARRAAWYSRMVVGAQVITEPQQCTVEGLVHGPRVTGNKMPAWPPAASTSATSSDCHAACWTTACRHGVYLCEHERGALGWSSNKPIDINLKNLFDKVELNLDREGWRRSRCSTAAGADRTRLRAARAAAVPPGTTRHVGAGGLDDHQQGREDLANGVGRSACCDAGLQRLVRRAAGRRTRPQQLAHRRCRPGVIFDTPIERRYDCRCWARPACCRKRRVT